MSDETVSEAKRYHVSASRSSFVSESYDTREEAQARMAALIAEGYPAVSFRDHEDSDDLW